jgi:MFS transporter, DHA1 family, inner membrane transport protein
MWLRIMVLALGTFALGTDNFVMSGLLPTIAHDFAVPVATTGWLVTVFALTFAVSAPTLAVLTSSIARRRLLMASLLLFVAANVLAAVAMNFGTLMLARILAAGAAALYTPTAIAVAAALAPIDKRGRALALVSAGATVATVLGVPVGTLVGTFFGWQMTFVLVAVLATLAAVGILLFFPEVASPAPISLGARLALLQNRQIVITLGLSILCLMGGFTVYTYLAAILQHITHLTGTGISSMLFVYGLASVVGNVLGGYGADRWGAVRTIVISLVTLGTALLALSLTASSVLGTAVTLLVWGIAAWMFIAPQQHRLLAMAPESPSVILSLNSSAVYLGIGSGAAAGGFVLHVASLSTLGWVGGWCQVLALGLLFLSTHLPSKRRAESQLCPFFKRGSGAMQALQAHSKR